MASYLTGVVPTITNFDSTVIKHVESLNKDQTGIVPRTLVQCYVCSKEFLESFVDISAENGRCRMCSSQCFHQYMEKRNMELEEEEKRKRRMRNLTVQLPDDATSELEKAKKEAEKTDAKKGVIPAHTHSASVIDLGRKVRKYQKTPMPKKRGTAQSHKN